MVCRSRTRRIMLLLWNSSSCAGKIIKLTLGGYCQDISITRFPLPNIYYSCLSHRYCFNFISKINSQFVIFKVHLLLQQVLETIFYRANSHQRSIITVSCSNKQVVSKMPASEFAYLSGSSTLVGMTQSPKSPKVAAVTSEPAKVSHDYDDGELLAAGFLAK